MAYIEIRYSRKAFDSMLEKSSPRSVIRQRKRTIWHEC